MDQKITLQNARLTDGSLVDLTVAAGRIVGRSCAAAAAPAGERPSLRDLLVGGAESPAPSTTLDLGGRLVIPALVNGHAHLDKTFVGAPWQPHRVGVGVPARVAAERRIRGGLEPVGVRSRALADELVRFGTGTVRTHVDIDPELGLSSLEALLELRSEFRDRLDIQIVAFPQSGILRSPGVAGLLDAALGLGADAIGGLDPIGYDGDAIGHLDIVFGLAERHGAGVDIHLHDLGAPASEQARLISERTRGAGLGGRVAISHGYGLGTLDGDELRRVADDLAASGVAVMTNGPAGPMPPVLTLRNAGVTVFAGSDNIRDAWWPFGEGDMLAVAHQVAYQSNFRTDDELAVALDLATGAAADALGLDAYGLDVGDRADLVVLDRESAAAAIAAAPSQRAVMHDGAFVSVTDLVRTRLATEVPVGA